MAKISANVLRNKINSFFQNRSIYKELTKSLINSFENIDNNILQNMDKLFLQKILNGTREYFWHEIINRINLIDQQEKVQKNISSTDCQVGTWINYGEMIEDNTWHQTINQYRCSCCGAIVVQPVNETFYGYCPNCGKKMVNVISSDFINDEE